MYFCCSHLQVHLTSTCHFGNIWRFCHLRLKAVGNCAFYLYRCRRFLDSGLDCGILTGQSIADDLQKPRSCHCFVYTIREARCDCPNVQSCLLLLRNWFQASSRSPLETYPTWRIYVSPRTSSAVKSKDLTKFDGRQFPYNHSYNVSPNVATRCSNVYKVLYHPFRQEMIV